jgi:signal recognition particle subunit SRP19
MGKKSAGRVKIKQVGPKGASALLGNPMEDFAIPPEEMIELPPPVDKSTVQIWPLAETFTMKYDNFSVIYPNYLDSRKTIKEGRRISAAEAVEKPTVLDIGMALQSLNIRHAVQPYKGYSRDHESLWDNIGRVLVDLPKNSDDGVMRMGADGAFDLDAADDENGLGNKKQLLREIAVRIPHLTSRKERLAREELQRKVEEQRAKEEAAKTAAAPKTATSSSTSNKKKVKGKKKK